MTDDTDSELNERIARLERTVRQQASRLEEIEGDDETLSVGRRTLLKTMGLAGLVGYGGGRVSADPKGQVGTAEDPLKALYTESLRGGITGGADVSSLVGENLSVTDGALTADVGPLTVSTSFDDSYAGVTEVTFDENLLVSGDGDGSVTVGASDENADTHASVSDDETTTVEDADDVNFGTGLDVTDDGNDTATVDVSASGSTVQAEYVTLSPAKGLNNERILNGAGGITLSDNGAGSDLDVASTAVRSPGPG
jgi:hypothetical protein